MGRDGDDLVLKNYQGRLYRYPDPVDQCMGDTPAPTPCLNETGETGMLIGLTYDLRDDYLNAGFSKEDTAEFGQ